MHSTSLEKHILTHMHSTSLEKHKQDQEHHIWCILRGPFDWICCASFTHHTREHFDYDRAGCLKCVTLHCCGSTTSDSRCPLETRKDGSVCCTLTGFRVSTVRYSDCEYVERFDPDIFRPNSRAERRLFQLEALFEHVQGCGVQLIVRQGKHRVEATILCQNIL